MRTWTSEGFITEQGVTIRVPGVPFLPAESPLLKEIIHRPVEVDRSEGRIYGLMPIWHSCGNDPIALHLARVDVATVLRVAEEGEYCNEVTERGWDDRCFYAYEERMAAATRSK